MTSPRLVPAQTVGPFFHDCMLRDPWNVIAEASTEGERIRIEGHVYDGDGAPVPDAVIELWQANVHGRYHHPADERDLPLDPSFTGFGRAGTDESGRYWFETIKPGPVPWEAGRSQAPHINVQVFARGLLDHLTTRLYFEDEPANDADPVLDSVPEHRRSTLLAKRVRDGDPATYQFDIVLQGENETVFFGP
ncbi:MAG: protocatechuate 3,4-dioxygenase subunit alpha [Actinomycetota bacterium]